MDAAVSASMVAVDEGDRVLRSSTYQRFVDLGRAPTAEEIAVATGRTTAEVRGAWRRLHEAHALVLHAGHDELRMVNPFSAVPTAHRVRAGGRWWYASCAWDAVGICAALGTDGDVESSCPDCGGAISVGIRDQRPTDETLVFHCLVPASSWWDDIAFT